MKWFLADLIPSVSVCEIARIKWVIPKFTKHCLNQHVAKIVYNKVREKNEIKEAHI